MSSDGVVSNKQANNNPGLYIIKRQKCLVFAAGPGPERSIDGVKQLAIAVTAQSSSVQDTVSLLNFHLSLLMKNTLNSYDCTSNILICAQVLLILNRIITLTFLKTNSCTFCKIHSHSHLKLQTVKNVCETHNWKPYMFRS
jgi:hypothetical protein